MRIKRMSDVAAPERKCFGLHGIGPGATVFLVAAVLLLATGGCAAPFAEMQSARLAGPGRVELTPAYSYMDIADDGETARIQDVYGVHVATGITSRVDVRARLEHIVVDDAGGADFTATTLGIGPKFGLIPNRLALYLPVGFAFGDDIEMSDTWQFHPSIIGTVQLARTVELNGGFKALIPLSSSEDPDDDDVLLAFNAGLGIGPDLSRWAIRPEVGFLRNPGEGRSGTVRHFSLGVTVVLGKISDF
jgi:hypothetical protein